MVWTVCCTSPTVADDNAANVIAVPKKGVDPLGCAVSKDDDICEKSFAGPPPAPRAIFEPDTSFKPGTESSGPGMLRGWTAVRDPDDEDLLEATERNFVQGVLSEEDRAYQ